MWSFTSIGIDSLKQVGSRSITPGQAWRMMIWFSTLCETDLQISFYYISLSWLGVFIGYVRQIVADR